MAKLSPLFFLHTVGPHGGESLLHIIARKQREVASVGWTLWALKHYKPKSLQAWQQAIMAGRKRPHRVIAACVISSSSLDPSYGKGQDKGGRDMEWRKKPLVSNSTSCFQPVPKGIELPHVVEEATALVVKRFISCPDEINRLGLAYNLGNNQKAFYPFPADKEPIAPGRNLVLAELRSYRGKAHQPHKPTHSILRRLAFLMELEPPWITMVRPSKGSQS